MTEKKCVDFTKDEFNALAFAVKARLAVIESKALAFSGETPSTFKHCLEGDWEWVNLRSLCKKLEID